MAVVAAYREQFAVNDDDRRQVLGPHPDEDPMAELAHRYAVHAVAGLAKPLNAPSREPVAVAIGRVGEDTSGTAVSMDSRSVVRSEDPVEVTLAERRRAAREAERAARRARVGTGGRAPAERERGHDSRARRQPVQEQAAPPLLEPQPQRTQERGRQMGT